MERAQHLSLDATLLRARSLAQSLISISPTTLDPTVFTIPLCFVEPCIQTFGPPFNTPAEKHGTETAEEYQAAAQTIEWLLACWEEMR